MYYDYVVDVPKEKGISLKKRNGAVYVEYVYERVYDKTKKYTVPKSTTIGRLDENDDTKMYPNQSCKKYFPEVEIDDELAIKQHGSTLKIGTYAVIKKMLKESKVDEYLKPIIGDKLGLFLDLVTYLIITEKNVMQHYPSYAYNHPMFTDKMHVYSDSSVGEFLKSLSSDHSVEFLNKWNENHISNDKVYISYDSTNKWCQAGDIDISEYGYAKDGKGKPIVNYSIAYDATNSEPLFYEDYAGSTTDIVQLEYMIGKAAAYGYKNIGVIIDRGYFSKYNFKLLDKLGYSFIIMMKGRQALVKDIILKCKNKFEDDMRWYIPEFQMQGITVEEKLFPTDDKTRYIHLYYDSDRYAEERADIYEEYDTNWKNIQKYIGKQVELPKVYDKHFEAYYNDEGALVTCTPKNSVLKEEQSLCGYFCIVTSENMTAREALVLYKSRDASEKLFLADKTFLGNKTYRVHKREPMESKMFIGFVALIIRNRMYKYLNNKRMTDDKSKNYLSVPAAIAQLENIQVTKCMRNDYILDNALTKVQKDVLKAFDMNITDIKNVIKELNKIATEI